MLINTHASIHAMYYCNFTTRLYVQVAFNRDTVVTSYSDMHVGHVLCNNKRWSCIKKGFFFYLCNFQHLFMVLHVYYNIHNIYVQVTFNKASVGLLYDRVLIRMAEASQFNMDNPITVFPGSPLMYQTLA